MSQFWYNDSTQAEMAQELLDHANGGTIAILSAPSVMNGLQVSMLRRSGNGSSVVLTNA